MGNWRTLLGLAFSLLGVGASCSSIVFFYMENYHAATWALFSGVYAAINFHLYFLHWRRSLGTWHDQQTMEEFQLLAFFAIVAGIGASIWYIFSFIYYNLPILPVQDSYQIAAVWAFMTAKWGMGLFVTARHLTSQLDETYP